MHRTLLPLLSLSLALFAATALASPDAAMRQCRALGDASARLACYDAVPLPASAGATTSAAAAAGPAPMATPASTPNLTSSFGLTRPDQKLPDIRSHIVGAFEGWEARTRIRLANGQVWQISDDSSASYNLRDPKVTVRRAAMGSYMLDIEGAKNMPRVRRVE